MKGKYGPMHGKPSRQKYGAGEVAEGFAAGLKRQQVAALDEQLVRIKGAISAVTLACIRRGTAASDLVHALLADVDRARAQLREVEAPEAQP